jgi:hypothetical protein
MKAKSDILNRVRRTSLISFGALLLFLMQGFYHPAIAQHQAASHDEQEITLGKSVFNKVASNIRIIKASIDPLITKQNLTINNSKTYRAFSWEQTIRRTAYGRSVKDRIFFENRKTGILYEVVVLPDIHRPYDNLIWVNNKIFAFERSLSPHHSVRYVVDVRLRKLTAARSVKYNY